jgi:hypothetical protein
MTTRAAPLREWNINYTLIKISVGKVAVVLYPVGFEWMRLSMFDGNKTSIDGIMATGFDVISTSFGGIRRCCESNDG